MDFTARLPSWARLQKNREAIHCVCPVAISGANRFKRRRERLSSKIGTP
jgi:hypothetical protein